MCRFFCLGLCRTTTRNDQEKWQGGRKKVVSRKNCIGFCSRSRVEGSLAKHLVAVLQSGQCDLVGVCVVFSVWGCAAFSVWVCAGAQSTATRKEKKYETIFWLKFALSLMAPFMGMFLLACGVLGAVPDLELGLLGANPTSAVHRRQTALAVGFGAAVAGLQTIAHGPTTSLYQTIRDLTQVGYDLYPWAASSPSTTGTTTTPPAMPALPPTPETPRLQPYERAAALHFIDSLNEVAVENADLHVTHDGDEADVRTEVLSHSGVIRDSAPHASSGA